MPHAITWASSVGLAGTVLLASKVPIKLSLPLSLSLSIYIKKKTVFMAVVGGLILNSNDKVVAG